MATKDCFKGLILGGLIGAALGILYAPKSGKETRDDIARKADDLMANAKEKYEAAVNRLKQFESSAKDKVVEMEGKVEGLAERGKETIYDSKSRLKKAIDAGVGAFKEEKEKA
jgi:gas vesicle protein